MGTSFKLDAPKRRHFFFQTGNALQFGQKPAVNVTYAIDLITAQKPTNMKIRKKILQDTSTHLVDGEAFFKGSLYRRKSDHARTNRERSSMVLSSARYW